MASLFEETFRDRVTSAALRAFGVTVRFCRGPFVSDEFSCVRADREYTVIDTEYGVPTTVTVRDFEPLVSLLLIDGDEITPRVGDRFIEGDEIYEIHPPSEEMDAVELRSGSFDYLCHTKRIE